MVPPSGAPIRNSVYAYGPAVFNSNVMASGALTESSHWPVNERITALSSAAMRSNQALASPESRSRSSMPREFGAIFTPGRIVKMYVSSSGCSTFSAKSKYTKSG